MQIQLRLGKAVHAMIYYILTTVVLCYMSYAVGYRRGLGVSYEKVSTAARTWIQESGELLKRKWSDTL